MRGDHLARQRGSDAIHGMRVSSTGTVVGDDMKRQGGWLTESWFSIVMDVVTPP